MSGNTEMVVLDLKGAFSKMENPVERRALPPLARHPCREAIFAKRRRGGEIEGRIAVKFAFLRFRIASFALRTRMPTLPFPP